MAYRSVRCGAWYLCWTTTTCLAARLARNADDPTFRDLIARAGEVRLLAAAGFLLK
jgi:hypothetical protein